MALPPVNAQRTSTESIESCGASRTEEKMGTAEHGRLLDTRESSGSACLGGMDRDDVVTSVREDRLAFTTTKFPSDPTSTGDRDDFVKLVARSTCDTRPGEAIFFWHASWCSRRMGLQPTGIRNEDLAITDCTSTVTW